MALRNGEMYREALRDGRELYVDGERVDDVTTHPAVAPLVDRVAGVYDMQHLPDFHELMTWEGDDGERFSGSWLKPRDKAQGQWRRSMAQMIARETGGIVGRPPDLIAAALLGVLDIKDQFSQGNATFGENIERFYDYAMANDLAMAHAFVTEQLDANKPIDETDVPRIVRTTEDGIVVSGVWTVSTFAPYCDECFFGTFPRPGQRDEHVMYFVMPIGAPGLRIVSRPIYGVGEAAQSPLARIGDESDAMLVLDEVEVPWDRVFSHGDPSFAIRVFPKITEWVHWSILSRVAVKAEVLVGLGALLPEVIGRAETPHSVEVQGELVRYLTTIQAYLLAAEERGRLTASGYWTPDRIFVTAGRAYATQHYRYMLSHLQDLGGQGLIALPPQAALEHDVVGPTLSHMFTSGSASLEERTQIYRLAFDFTSSSIGGRQTLFELFNATPYSAMRAQLLRNVELDPFKDLARATAGLMDEPQARAAGVRAAQAALGGDQQDMYDRLGSVVRDLTGATKAGA